MLKAPDLARTLYCGDNLSILRTYLADESVDLIYLDPPFYSQRSYRAFFKQAPADRARASAFVDVWRWEPAVAESYRELLAHAPAATRRTLNALHGLLGPGPLLAYLVMLTTRLLELYRVLKPTGSLYLHCDPVASHYLKLLLDAVFGAANFRNEIVWSYKTGGASPRHFARKHDLIFFYSKSARYIFHAPKEKSYMMHRYGFKKSTFLRDTGGEYTWVNMKDVWEVPALGAADRQRLGYPTQKPEALLERIIRASSDEGGLVLDPFCGSGTTPTVAQRLGRNWLSIESHFLGIAYQRYRLASAFPQLCYSFIGGPATLAEARRLAHADLAQFHWWALSLVCARPIGIDSQNMPDNHPGAAHGVLPEQAGDQAPALVIVIPELLEAEVIRCWSKRVALNGEIARMLVLTLEEPTQEIRSNLARSLTSGGSSPASIDIVTIADLLSC
ncbi:MAG TPA: site-specific DNA-methyltransferase [Ktedonobacteraceae bacterium]|nr:site-specific DNA-methyltransferase [Ktedonobacteraceae bacterium]